jgi:hypothetical protein
MERTPHSAAISDCAVMPPPPPRPERGRLRSPRLAALAALAALVAAAAAPRRAVAAAVTLPAGSPKALTSGSVVVLRIGDGSTTLTSSATAGWLDEYVATSGTFSWVNSISLPCTFCATCTAEAFIATAPDASAVYVPC